MAKLVLVVATLLAVGSMPLAAGAAEATTVVKASISGQYENQCTGETILTSGTSVLIFKGASGEESYPVFERAIFEGTAVGQTTGTTYRVVVSAMDPGVTNVTTDGAIESTDVLIYRFIAPGVTEDLFLRIAHHTTFSATGALTASPIVVDARCFQ